MRVRITRPAIEDLREAFDFIGQDSPRAAGEVLDTISEAIRSLGEMPGRGRVGRIARTRELVVRTGHVVVYAVNADEVVVLYVRHGKRRWPPK